MRLLRSWLQANNGAIIAVATTLYAFFTVLLWFATKRQANITQRMFEASQRPWVSVPLPNFTREDRRFKWDFCLENKGAVPAVLTGWHVTVSQHGRNIKDQRAEGAEIVLAVFPGASQKLPTKVEIEGEPVLAAQGGELTVVKAMVQYRGLGETVYSTRVVCELILTPEKTIWGCREIRLDV